MSAPVSHLEDAQRLTGDGIVYLYEVRLQGGNVLYRFKNDDTVTWQGNTYEGIPCQMAGESMSADDQEARPTLRVYNPFGIFNQVALDGGLYRAIVIRKRVLRQHIDSNTNIFIQRMWFVERPKELVSGQYISLDLRSMIEGQNFQIPVRQYTPPDFPLVTF